MAPEMSDSPPLNGVIIGPSLDQTNTSEVEVETEDERDAGIPSQDLNAHLDQATQSDDDDADDADEGNYGDSDDDPMNDSGDDDGVDNDNSAGSNEHNDLGNQHDNDEYNNHHGEDDDECMIIDGQDLPDSLKAKFAEQEFGAWGDGAAAEDVVYMGTRIKMEENDGVNYSVTSESSSDNDGTEFEVDENDDLSDGERPRKRPRRPTRQQGKQKQKSKKTTPGRNNTEPKGKQGDEEWIEPTDEELTELTTQRERLRARKARGQNLTLSQKLTLAQVTARLKEIETKAAEQDAEVDDQAIEQALAKVKARVQLPSASGRLSPAPFENAADANMEGLSQAPGSSKPQTARKKPPRSAKEYWERVYANNGFAQDSGASKAGKRKRQTRGRGKKNTKKGAGRESRLMRMLQDVNPIMARAAQGAVIMPGPVQTKRLDDQLKAMKAFRFKISSNPNTRSPSVDLQDRKAGRHQTLIVAPAVAINQWRKEIEKHCEKSFIRVVHHYQAKQKLQLELWKSADVVLVSYNEVSNAYPSEQTLKRFAGMKLSDEEWGEKFDQELGELFRTEFFRVVLDEGHAIRNLRSKTSKACQQLSSKFRWILSGTPLHNSIDELYAYFRFLGAHYDEDYGEFCKRFGDIEKDGVKERLDAMVTSLMLRRHVHDHFAGVPILEIPQTHPIRLIWVDLTQAERLIYRSRFGETFDMDSQFQEMEANAQMADIICRMCYELPVDPRITECGHTFCAQCINDRLQLSESCPCCKVLLHNVDYLKEPEHRLVEDPDADGCQKKSKERKRKKDKREIGEDEHGVQLKLKDSSKWIREYDESHPYKPLLASAKTIAVKSQILAWQRQAPEDKIIVFVNWAKLAGIIGRMLFEEHIPFLYYFGDMTKGQKIAAVADFEDRPEIKVLIASIRCGGQALNLNFANRVISVDQWWNTAMENQAFGRVHRIGQRKETYFVKIAVKDTVDERLLAMQGDKDRLIRQALQEDAAHRTAPTLEELMKLFGVDAAENEAGELVVAPAAEDEGAGDGNGNGNGVGGDNAGEVIEIGDDSDGNGEAAERASLDGE
ncbi:hypothetical protein VTK26DRAFT_4482 [Humicola hyalothermophila]